MSMSMLNKFPKEEVSWLNLLSMKHTFDGRQVKKKLLKVATRFKLDGNFDRENFLEAGKALYNQSY